MIKCTAILYRARTGFSLCNRFSQGKTCFHYREPLFSLQRPCFHYREWVYSVSILWQYGLWSFQTGGTKLKIFLPKNKHTERKLSNFENWVTGEVSKSAKSPNLLTFKVNFLCQKLSESFSIFFSLKNTNLGAHFLLLTLFDRINF